MLKISGFSRQNVGRTNVLLKKIEGKAQVIIKIRRLPIKGEVNDELENYLIRALAKLINNDL